MTIYSYVFFFPGFVMCAQYLPYFYCKKHVNYPLWSIMWSCFIFLECTGICAYLRWYLKELNMLGAEFMNEEDMSNVQAGLGGSGRNSQPEGVARSGCSSVRRGSGDPQPGENVGDESKDSSFNTAATQRERQKAKNDYISSLDVSTHGNNSDDGTHGELSDDASSAEEPDYANEAI
jgi:hypothetical protein